MTHRFAAVALALLALSIHPDLSSAQAPSPPAGWEYEEERTRAREDVATLDAYVKAKAARLREAEVRFDLAKDRQVALDRQKSKGFISGLLHFQGEVSVAEGEAERETRAAELKEVETRRDRARRRLSLIERGLRPAPIGPESLLSDHRELDRIRTELDGVKLDVQGLQAGP